MFHRFILFGFALLITLAFPTGCNGLRFRPFSRADHAESTKEGDMKSVSSALVETCYKVPGPVMKLQLSQNRKYLAVLWHDASRPRPTNPREQTNWQASLLDVEFSRSEAEAEEILSGVTSVFSTAFDEENCRLYVADASGDRARNSKGQIKPNIRVFDPVAERYYEHILAEDFDEERIRLSNEAHWIACRDRLGQWRLIDREEPSRVVVFPELEVDVASESFESRRRKKCHVTEILAFSPQNDFVATLVSDLEESEQSKESGNDSESGVYRTIIIWDLHVVDTLALKDAKRLPLEAIMVSKFRAKDGVERRRCAFSPDGTMIAVRSKSKYIGVWETSNGELFAELGEHRERITSLNFSPNNLELIVGTGGQRGRLLLWDIRKEAVNRFYEEADPEVRSVTAVAFSPDGYRVWFGTNTGEIKTWRVRD